MSRPKNKPVDMSVEPEQRRRRHRGRKADTPPAQMDHGTSPRARALRRDGERWLTREQLRRIAETPEVAEWPEPGEA